MKNDYRSIADVFGDVNCIVAIGWYVTDCWTSNQNLMRIVLETLTTVVLVAKIDVALLMDDMAATSCSASSGWRHSVDVTLATDSLLSVGMAYFHVDFFCFFSAMTLLAMTMFGYDLVGDDLVGMTL